MFKNVSLMALLAIAMYPGAAMANDKPRKNVLGRDLSTCCDNPKTGYLRDGLCRAIDDDHGTHTVCAVVTQAFLEFTKARGNDLITPNPGAQFPGLKPNDRWCLCALRWREALDAHVAPPVVLESTDEKTLEFIPMKILKEHAHRPKP